MSGDIKNYRTVQFVAGGVCSYIKCTPSTMYCSTGVLRTRVDASRVTKISPHHWSSEYSYPGTGTPVLKCSSTPEHIQISDAAVGVVVVW